MFLKCKKDTILNYCSKNEFVYFYSHYRSNQTSKDFVDVRLNRYLDLNLRFSFYLKLQNLSKILVIFLLFNLFISSYLNANERGPHHKFFFSILEEETRNKNQCFVISIYPAFNESLKRNNRKISKGY